MRFVTLNFLLLCFVTQAWSAEKDLLVWRLKVATGEITGKTVIDGRWSTHDPGVTFHDSQSRANDILTVDRAGVAVHLRDIAINPESLDWLNLAYYGAKVKKGSAKTASLVPAVGPLIAPNYLLDLTS